MGFGDEIRQRLTDKLGTAVKVNVADNYPAFAADWFGPKNIVIVIIMFFVVTVMAAAIKSKRHGSEVHPKVSKGDRLENIIHKINHYLKFICEKENIEFLPLRSDQVKMHDSIVRGRASWFSPKSSDHFKLGDFGKLNINWYYFSERGNWRYFTLRVAAKIVVMRRLAENGQNIKKNQGLFTDSHYEKLTDRLLQKVGLYEECERLKGSDISKSSYLERKIDDDLVRLLKLSEDDVARMKKSVKPRMLSFRKNRRERCGIIIKHEAEYFKSIYEDCKRRLILVAKVKKDDPKHASDYDEFSRWLNSASRLVNNIYQALEKISAREKDWKYPLQIIGDHQGLQRSQHDAESSKRGLVNVAYELQRIANAQGEIDVLEVVALVQAFTSVESQIIKKLYNEEEIELAA